MIIVSNPPTDSARSALLNSIFPKANAHLLVTCVKPGGWMEVNVLSALKGMWYLMETAF